VESEKFEFFWEEIGNWSFWGF